MRPGNFLFLSVGILALAGLTACQGPFAKTGPRFDARPPDNAALTNFTDIEVTNRVSQELLSPADEPFTLGPGDQIEAEILNDPGTRSMLTVGPDGKIYFHFLPGIDVWGLTLGQTKELLERELTQYMAGPQVVVTLRAIESKRVWLLGRLHNSGIYTVRAPMTLLEAISMAGGLLSPTGPGITGTEELADLQHSFVVRQGEVLPVDFDRLIRQGDMTQNIYLRGRFLPGTRKHSEWFRPHR